MAQEHHVLYPRGKCLVKFFKVPGKGSPAEGLQAELNTRLPNVRVPKDLSPVEVSAELAWTLVTSGRAEIVDEAAQAQEVADDVFPEPEKDGILSKLKDAIIPKAESAAVPEDEDDDNDEAE